MADLSGKVALVTGAGLGIGREIALKLAAAGASVAVNDVDQARCSEVVGVIQTMGGKAKSYPGDVANVAAIRTTIAQIGQDQGHLDIACCNAGITNWCAFLDYEPEGFDQVMSVNMRGSYFTAQAAARQMISQGSGGRLLFTSSVAGVQAIQGLSAYGMTKAALRMLARSLAVELAPHRITVNALGVGATVTERTLSDDPEYEANWHAVTPTGRPGYPADIAGVVLFLCSPEAAHINGHTLMIDGGWTTYSPVIPGPSLTPPAAPNP